MDKRCLQDAFNNGTGHIGEEKGFRITFGSTALDQVLAVTINEAPTASYVWAAGESAAVSVKIPGWGTAVWETTVRREPGFFWGQGCGWLFPEGCGCDSSCGGGDCMESEGEAIGSVRFRIPLGFTAYKTLAGMVWFKADGGSFAVSPYMFSVTGNVSVVQEFEEGVLSRVYCNDANGGRDVRIGVIGNGVSVSIGDYCSTGFSADYVWEITNPNDEHNKVLFEKKVNDVAVRSASYEWTAINWFGDGVWSRTDGITGLCETSSRVGNINAYGWEYDEYVQYAQAGGARVSGRQVSKHMIGSGAGAVARETSASEWDGVLNKWEIGADMDYWEDDQNQLLNGLPKFKHNIRNGSWEYLAYDRRGRETLRADPLDGSGQPPFANADVPFALADMGQYGPFTARLTVTGYGADGEGSYLDGRKPRTVTGYAVTGGVATVVSKEWHAYSRGEAADGYSSITHRVTRAASQAAGVNDGGNLWTETVAYADDEDSVPVLLRGRPLREEGKDGTLLTWEYEYDDTEFDGTNDLLYVTAKRGTATHPDGLANVSTYEVETLDAVFGRTAKRETRLYTGGSSDPVISGETRDYDAKGRLLSVSYPDGTCESNEWDCCQLTATVGRNGTRRTFTAVPGDVRWKMTAEVSSSGLPGAGGSYPVTETYADASGRETNSVKCVYNGDNADSNYVAIVTGTAYPYGTDNYRVTTDPLGIETVSQQYYGSNCEVERTSSTGVTSTVTRVNGGATVDEKKWADPVSGVALSLCTRTDTSWTTGGHEVQTVSVSRSGGAWSTESVTESDMTGRAVSVSRAGSGGAMLVTSNVYGNAGMLVRTIAPDGSSQSYAYDVLGSRVAVISVG
ncbi:MAG: hypothetical protein WCK89_22670, partial [bacterium]